MNIISIDIQTHFFLWLVIPLLLTFGLSIFFDNIDFHNLQMFLSATYQIFGAGLLLIASFKSHIFDVKIKNEDKIEHKELFKLGAILLLSGLMIQAFIYYSELIATI